MRRGVPRCEETSTTSGRNSFLVCFENLVGEEIDLVEGRVDVRRDPNALELRMYDRRVHDPVLRHQPRTELYVVEPVARKKRKRAGVLVVEWRQNANP